MTTTAQVQKMEEAVMSASCAFCGTSDGAESIRPPAEHDESLPEGLPPLRAMLLHLTHNKVVPSGDICESCVRRAVDAYEFSAGLSRAEPPLSDKIRALRKRLHELTQKIDVFIVVGGSGQDGASGTYSEEDIIMVERGALAAAAAADCELERATDAKGDPVYQCSVCPLSFQRMSELRTHLSTHPADARHSCWTCGAQCGSRDELLTHARAHQSAPAASKQHQAHECHLCTSTFPSLSLLRRHETSCPSLCPACAELQGTRAELAAHAAALHGAAGPPPHVCPVCFQMFDAPALLTAHAVRHRQDKQFVCGYDGCILRFATRSTLMSHIRKCHGGGDDTDDVAAPAADTSDHCCQHCYRTFASAPALKRHMKVHRNEIAAKQEVEEVEETGLLEEQVEYLEVETLEEEVEEEPDTKPDLQDLQ